MSEEEYRYESATAAWDNSHIVERVEASLQQRKCKRVFELGCGNGATLARLAKLGGLELSAIEYSKTGVAMAQQNCPSARVEVGSAYDDLLARFGLHDAVVSIEVLEHLYDPRLFAKRVFELLKPGGVALVSTPYHGYLKNLALALFNRFDYHANPLWDHGHIKFFSPRTLTRLFEEEGFRVQSIARLGRIPPLAKTMLAVLEKPA
jgi:2-polyprenyl-3-methyl-5-hydroxy-6-metoxy-1,4-benzoquinol methylase